MLENKFIYKGVCPICDRPMYDDGKSINQHHFLPKSKGGKEQEYLHRICHDQIHGLWTNNQLEHEFSVPETIKNSPLIENFLKWIKNKDPLFYLKTKPSKNKK
jgi:hypothetical protein